MEAVTLHQLTASEVARVLGNRKASNGWWLCSCPCSYNHANGDKNPSLSLKDGEDGNLIVKCQTGCEARDIYQALRDRDISFYQKPFNSGLSRKSPSPNKPKPLSKLKAVETSKGSKTTRGKLVAEYFYASENGEMIVTKQRYENLCVETGEKLDEKCFSITPSGQTKKFVLYNLPHIKLARENDWVVYLCEGEKDADRLTELNLVATSTIEGASKGEVKWRESYTNTLSGLNVVILADNDEAGINQAKGVAALLNGKVASVKVVEFPELPEKGDVSDYLNHHSLDEFIAKVEATPLYIPPSQIKAFEFNDVGNAERLAHYSQGSLGYCESWDSWISYNGKVWKKSNLLAVKTSKEVVKLILKECELYSSEDEQTKVFKHYQASQKGGAIKNMLYLARDCVTQIEISQLDSSPDLFNANNGTIDLRTGRIKPHCKDDLLTKICPLDYNPEAAAPRWEQFLHEIFEGNTELIDYIQRAVGYSLTGHSSERAFFILHGNGRNGKSTFVETTSAILGEDYAAGMPTESLYTKRSDGGVPNDTARLRGSRFVSASEGEDGKHLAVAKIKQLTGNEKITTRHMKGEWFDYLVAFKVWFSTNHKPEITESAEAIWDRVKLIPFNKRFTDEEKDPHLRLTLLKESPGILTWAVNGARKWYELGLGDCEAVRAATNDYRKDSDLVGKFLEDCCELGAGKEIRSKSLYEAFEGWSKEQGLPLVMSSQAFSKRLQERGFHTIPRTGNKHFWQEVALQVSAEEIERY